MRYARRDIVSAVAPSAMAPSMVAPGTTVRSEANSSEACC